MPSTSNVPEGLISNTETFDAQTPVTKLLPSVLRYGAVIINDGTEYLGIIDSRTLYRHLSGFTLPQKETAAKFAVRVPRVTDTTSIDELVYYFYKSRTKSLPYVKNGKIRGMLRRQTLIKMLLSLNRLSGLKVGDAMVSPLLAIESDATIAQAKATMRAHKVNRLGVLENDRFVGLLTNYDLVEKYSTTPERLPEHKRSSYKPANIGVGEAVERNPVRIGSSDDLKEAAKLMVERNVSSLVVTKGSKPVGIVTELDIITSVLGTYNADQNKIFIAGLDQSTYEYEDEARGALRAFIDRIQRMHGVDVEYLSLVVKKFRSNSYELYARLSITKRGILTVHVSGHIFERMLAELLRILDKEVKREKDTYLSVRKVSHNTNPAEEPE